MLCFDVYRNGEKLCTAGVGDYGVLTAILSWVLHHPEKLAKWAAEGVPETEPRSLDFSVSGLGRDDSASHDSLKWVRTALTIGDEVRIRIIESPSPDLPKQSGDGI